MKLLAPALVAALLLATGCPRNLAPGNPASDEDQAERVQSQLEEIRARVQAEPPTCPAWCELAKKTCDLSAQACALSGRHPDRLDYQKRCISSQEDCARFNDQCSRCR